MGISSLCGAQFSLQDQFAFSSEANYTAKSDCVKEVESSDIKAKHKSFSASKPSQH